MFRSIPSLAARIAVLVGLTALLAGCPATAEKTTRDERWYDAVVEPMQSKPERALEFYDRIMRLKGAELARELELSRQAFAREKSDLSRMELSMILSLPGAPFRDEQAAATLLQPLLREGGEEESPLRPLAVFLNAQLAEARRAEESAQLHAAKARDEQKRAEALQQKLEALLEMEKSLIEREQTIPPKKK